jgi:membrane-associated phospholipid phosphatase
MTEPSSSTNSRRDARTWRSGLFHVRGPALDPRVGIAAIVALTGVVAVCCAVAWNGDVPGWEQAALKFFNGWPDWLEPVMWVIQQPGVLFFPYAVGAVIVLATRRWHYALPFALLPIFKLTVEKELVKPLVERARPFSSVGPEIEARGSALLDEPAFPSGHATTAAATGLLIAAFLPVRWRPVAIIWGFFVGLARLYYGEHNLLDVVAGASLGTIFAVAIYLLLFNRWVGDGPASRRGR